MQHFGRFKRTFFTPYINIGAENREEFITFAPEKMSKMVTELLIVWIVGVVAFFALWAILLKVIKRISERKGQKEECIQDNADKDSTQQS